MSRVSRPAKARPDAGQDDDDNSGDDSALAVMQRHASVATTGVQKPAGAAASVFEVGHQARTAAKRTSPKPAPVLDAQAIVIEDGIPLPSPKGRVRSHSYYELLGRMQPGNSVVLPAIQAMSLVRMARKAKVPMKTVGLPDGTKRVWRLAADATPNPTTLNAGEMQ